MNLQECWRDRIKDANPFRAKNHSVNSWRINKEIQGERRLSTPTKESRAQRKRDKRTLERVRKAINTGDYGCLTPQQIGKDIAYLLDQGYKDFDMITTPTIDMTLSPAPVIEVAAAAD